MGTAADIALVIDIESFMIPFEIPYNGCMKEVSVPIYSTWYYAQLTIAETMVCRPEKLCLGYVNPFKAASAGRKPMSLESDAEWGNLIQHVRTHLAAQNAKNHGKGGVSKPWCITLIDLRAAAPAKVCDM